jgi:hypothetical protein
MNVSKDKAQAITAEIQAAVQVILEKHELQASKVRTKYGDGYQFSVQADAIEINASGVNLASTESQVWTQVGKSYGFADPVSVLGAEFTQNGKSFKFLGFNPNAVKFPLVAKNLADGKTYKLTIGSLKLMPTFNPQAVAEYLKSELGVR